MYGYEVRESECKAMTACTGVKWERVSVSISQHVHGYEVRGSEGKGIAACMGMKWERVSVRL